MSSPKHVADPVTSSAPEATTTPAKKPRASRAAKKEDVPAEAAAPKEKEAKTKGATKRKGTGVSHPPFEEIIRECISDSKGDVREGVSRPAIKKFIEERYGLPMNGLTISNINRAIINGEKKGIFVLPKGASGKIKLAKRAPEDKENSEPSSKSTARRIAIAKNNAKKEKEAAKAAVRATAPKRAPAPKKAAATPRAPLKKTTTNVKAKKAAAKATPAKKTAPSATERKKKVAKATAAVAAKVKRESATGTAPSSTRRGRASAAKA